MAGGHGDDWIDAGVPEELYGRDDLGERLSAANGVVFFGRSSVQGHAQIKAVLGSFELVREPVGHLRSDENAVRQDVERRYLQTELDHLLDIRVHERLAAREIY